MPISLYFIGAVCVGVMGFAIQFGATCTVAAVEEVFAAKTFNRLISLAEAALWVGCGIVITHYFGVSNYMPVGHAAGGIAIAGGVLLGLGAYINGACVFGAIANVGSGNWVYLLTPVGYFLACLTTAQLVPLPTSASLDLTAPLLRAPDWLIASMILIATVRLGFIAAGVRNWRARADHYRPHLGTLMIGLTFLVMLLTAGPWTYMEILKDLARGEVMPNAAFRVMLLVMLIVGAVIGGWFSGKLQWRAITVRAALRCLVGGFVMSLGGQLIPGQNDGLILTGLPLIWPYAWLAFATMCATIAAARTVTAKVSRA